jgi:hypothetical protein
MPRGLPQRMPPGVEALRLGPPQSGEERDQPAPPNVMHVQ